MRVFMRQVTHHITATGSDGESFEVEYGYDNFQRRLLKCKHCDWELRITFSGPEKKGLAHLAEAHGAGRVRRMAVDVKNRNQSLGLMLACFAVAGVILLVTVVSSRSG